MQRPIQSVYWVLVRIPTHDREATMSAVRTLRELDYHDSTDSLLLCYSLGSAATPYGKLAVVGSGRLVRFTLEGHDGYVDLDLTNYASAALAWLARDDATDEGQES
jgi:hypothetical protein